MNDDLRRSGTDAPGSATRLDRLAPGWAALALLALVASMAACGVLVREEGRDPETVGPVRTDRGDLHLFRTIVGRVEAGEDYHDVFGDEARRQGYGTRSVFNWRTPLHLWSLGQLPGPAWRLGFFGALVAATLAASCLAMERDGGLGQAALHGILLAPFLMASAIGLLFAESWAGSLVVLSIGLSAVGWRRASVAAGILALFFRELALPYVAIALTLAWLEGRRSEWRAWLAGLAAYLAYFAIHAARVSSRIGDADLAYPSGWLQWGGPSFAIRTATFGTLSVLPGWVQSLVLPLAFLGMASRRGPLARIVSLTTACYALAFCVVGKPFNEYWGLMYAPLLSFGLAWSPAALRDLARSLLAGRPPVRAASGDPGPSRPISPGAERVHSAGRPDTAASASENHLAETDGRP